MEYLELYRGKLQGHREKMLQQRAAIESLRDGVSILSYSVYAEYIQDLQANQIQISSITSVDQNMASLEESRAAVKQGENIRILTLITIAYLPVSLVTVRTHPA
jgi:Mg2+ and Co2+ transporter CorA